jgi:hypothetical protein
LRRWRHGGWGWPLGSDGEIRRRRRIGTVQCKIVDLRESRRNVQFNGWPRLGRGRFLRRALLGDGRWSFDVTLYDPHRSEGEEYEERQVCGSRRPSHSWRIVLRPHQQRTFRLRVGGVAQAQV